jgi:hypothetical protein
VKSILHNYNHAAGQTLFWDTSDNQENYKKNTQDPAKKSKLEQLGYLDAVIEYRFNQHGFRTAEFDHEFEAVCFGCSFTMGTGVHNQHTWPEQLAKSTGLDIANLAHAGSSNDTAYRIAHHYLKFLRPRYAIWLQTDRARIELVDDHLNMTINILPNDNNNLFSDNLFVKTWMLSETSQQISLDKNTRAFVNLCEQLDIRPIILAKSEIISKDFARDLQHPGPRSYQQLAEKISLLMAN